MMHMIRRETPAGTAGFTPQRSLMASAMKNPEANRQTVLIELESVFKNPSNEDAKDNSPDNPQCPMFYVVHITKTSE
jgi:hypothetical protein